VGVTFVNAGSILLIKKCYLRRITMNVLYHHRTRGTGAEGVHITGIFDAINKIGHQATMLSFPGAEPNIKKDTSPSKVVLGGKRSLNPLKLLANLTQKMPQSIFEMFELAYNVIALPRVLKAIKSDKSEMVYERYSLFMFTGVVAAKMRGIEIVIEVNDSVLVERVRPLKFKWLAKKIEQWVFSNVDGIIFISSYFKEISEANYLKLAPSKVCSNAVNLDHFDISTMDKNESKHKLGLSGKTVVGYVGAFVHWHGIDWFVDGMVSRLKEHPDLVLLLVGEGTAYSAIEQYVKEADVENQVVLTGYVPHSQVSDYLKAMDFGILPDSNHYGSPMKLFEFMAMKVPMVAPDFSPISEVLTDGVNGWLFEAENHVACIDKVLSLIDEVEEIERVGLGARQYIEEKGQWIHNAQAILESIPEHSIQRAELV